MMERFVAVILILMDILHGCPGLEHQNTMIKRNASDAEANNVRKYEFEKNHSPVNPAISPSNGEQTMEGYIFAAQIGGLADESMHSRGNEDDEDTQFGDFINSQSRDRRDAASEGVAKDDDELVDLNNDFLNTIVATSSTERELRRRSNIRKRRSIIDDLMKVYREATSKVNDWQRTGLKQPPGSQLRMTVPKMPSSGLSATQRMEALAEAGAYMRDHKFGDFDRRFYSDADNPRSLFSSRFPLPRLRSMNLELAAACKVNVDTCLWHVDQVAKYGKILARKVKAEHADWETNDTLKGVVKHAPFAHYRARFRYRTTASYYLCWYTMREDPVLRRFGRTCGFPQGSDYRTTDAFDFGCARVSFCPDPCCGTYAWNGFLPDSIACRKYPTNPCYGIGNGECVILRENTNFDALIRNRMNISCPCTDHRGAGFVFNNRFRQCIDVDECAEGKHNCKPTEACRNTLGSYSCVCAAGYDFVNGACQPWAVDPL